MSNHKSSAVRFLLEALLVMMLTFACGCGSSADSRTLIGGAGSISSHEEVRDHYDAKSGTYVTAKQYRSYRTMDWIKRVGGAFTILIVVLMFVFRRANHTEAVLRAKALGVELGVPVIYLMVIYIGSYFLDNPIHLF